MRIMFKRVYIGFIDNYDELSLLCCRETTMCIELAQLFRLFYDDDTI